VSSTVVRESGLRNSGAFAKLGARGHTQGWPRTGRRAKHSQHGNAEKCGNADRGACRVQECRRAQASAGGCRQAQETAKITFSSARERAGVSSPPH